MHLRYPELPPLGIIAAILVLTPLPGQIRARNVATISIIFWFFEHCLVSGINARIWAGNVNDSAPSWCDLSEALCDLSDHRALTKITGQRHILMMQCALHSLLRRSASAKISNSSLLDDRFLLRSISGVECASRCLCASCCLAYGCFCVSQTASPCVQTLPTLTTQSTASNPYATLS